MTEDRETQLIEERLKKIKRGDHPAVDWRWYAKDVTCLLKLTGQ